MLADPKAEALVRNFAGQWLFLRDLDTVQTEAEHFDDNLRQSFKRETEMLFGSIVREDRSLLELLDADYTFVDERLARHYGIPNVYGSYFRRVSLDANSPRRGILGQGSMQTVTSVATRTSPVMRGKWVLENILGAPPPEPPPGVEVNLDPTPGAVPTTLRQRLEQHRANPVCASCHKVMDPIGFALENFDLVGAWRETDGPGPIDASGQLADGTPLKGPADLRRALVSRSDAFLTLATEKLLTYAMGRPVGDTDMSAVRAIVRRMKQDGNRFSALVVAVTQSAPFRMRKSRRHRRSHGVSDQDPPVAPHVPARRRRHAGVAPARLDGPGRDDVAQTAAKARTRFGAIYVPHGAIMPKWTPRTAGAGFELSEIMQPLQPFYNQVTAVSGLEHAMAYGSGATANHNRSAAAFLSGAFAKPGAKAQLGITIDQVIARAKGQDTPLPSLELMIEDPSLNCGDGLSCSYRDTISWQGASSPLPMQNNPQVVFERLFGDGSTDAERAARRKQSLSLLDSVAAEAGVLQRKLPTSDRARLDQYLDRCSRDRAPHPEGRRQPERRSRHPRRANRRAQGCRAAHQADVRPAGAGVAGGDHARLDVPDVQGAEQRRVSQERHPRRVPHAVAPFRRAVEHRPLHGAEQYHYGCLPTS